MRLIWRALGWLWSGIGLVLVFATGMHAGQWIGYGKGARDTAQLMIEMRQGDYETPAPWTRGGI